MQLNSRIFIAGHRGLVGSALVRKLQSAGHRDLLLRSRSELDLLDQAAVNRFFRENAIDFVFVAAAKVGGIHANNTYPADFLYENLMIAANVMHAAANHSVKKLLYLGSSCIYPKHAPQPIREESLLSGALEPTNEPYAISKIAGLKLCESYQRQHGKRFVAVMPTNLYGIGDNFHPDNSHVIPGMMRRFHEAKRSGADHVTIWGTGTPRREFLHVDDLAEALYVVMQKHEGTGIINIGTGQDCTISELAHVMKEVVGFQGKLLFDPSKPDGTPRKVLDVSKMKALGWKPMRELREGLQQTYGWAVETGQFDVKSKKTA